MVLSDVPPNSTVVGVPAHIIYRNGHRVLITDPHDVKDPLSDALIALAARVDALEAGSGAEEPCVEPFAAEEADREAYRVELERLRVYVSMGEGATSEGEFWESLIALYIAIRGILLWQNHEVKQQMATRPTAGRPNCGKAPWRWQLSHLFGKAACTALKSFVFLRTTPACRWPRGPSTPS